eukprot:scaffold12037_cov159-Ochromonas_danica.AAC.10
MNVDKWKKTQERKEEEEAEAEGGSSLSLLLSAASAHTHTHSTGRHDQNMEERQRSTPLQLCMHFPVSQRE